ncbi:hypothetical protein [Arthrobacter sp. zg-Y877]|uniref:hypothetical protein n=1 Tax=Arthrobacter sp. zg-Y877 TaxID=3049074 RepID=UPI0025A32AAE|nr:hypothetical protein [Arthrobacter sp. zg-Y877]MDM7991625.1 hypothetical protein [Arthrobacter sp. zg-Y877]
MGFEAVEPQQRQLLKKALDDAQLSVPEVWLQYFRFGGAAGEYEVDAYINGSLSLPLLQRDILAHAANELIDLLPPRRRAPYGADVKRTPGEDDTSKRRPGDAGGD